MEITLAGSAVAYAPNQEQLSATSLEFGAFDGTVGTGILPISDDAFALAVLGGRACLVEEGTTLLTDGFVIDHDRDRGPVPVGRQYSFGVVDANALLDGFRVTRSRPSETDVARVLAFAAIDGPTWDTTWVLNSDTVAMPKKKYDSDGGWTSELIPDLVEFTGKTLFLHDLADGSGRCLHYHVLTTGHTSGLAISDVIADVDQVTTYFPQNPSRQRTSIDLRNNIRGRDQDNRRYTATDATSITNHDADGLRHEALVDFEADSAADLAVKTEAFLASQKNELSTYSCEIGPLDEDALALIRAGDYILTTSSVFGLTASSQRIAHMKLRPVAGRPSWWIAALELGRPIRRRARIKARRAADIPPPFSPTPCATAWDSLDDRETLMDSADWGSTSADTISWVVSRQNAGDALTTAKAWVSGGIGYLQSAYALSNLPVAHVASGFAVANDWEALFRFRITGAPPQGYGPTAVLAVSIIHAPTPSTNTHIFASARDPDEAFVPGDIATDTWYFCRFARENAGPTFRWRTWVDGVGEPSTWDDTAAAGATPTAFGFVLHSLGSGGGLPTAELHVDWVDDGAGCEANDPASGQNVTQNYDVSDGVTTDYRTRDPYTAGSLQVYADDIREWHITETNPATGEWAFDTAPFASETIRTEYKAA